MPAPHHSVFTGQMPFLPPNQQRQSTEGIQSTVQEQNNNRRMRSIIPRKDRSTVRFHAESKLGNNLTISQKMPTEM